MRKFSTQYKEEPLSKMELEYNGNKLTGVYLYETDNGTWKKTGEMNYSYISGNIDRITSLNHGKEQVYTYGYDGNGNPATFKYRNNQGDVNVKLKYNPDGFMTSCEYGNGVKYTMTYESGNGNFFMLSGYLNSILGFPVVK